MEMDERNKRIGLLDVLVDTFCELLAIDTVEVVVADGGKREKGKDAVSSFYEGKIYISDYYLLNNNLHEVIITLAHECRHAYQWHEVYGDDPIEDKEVIEQWKYEFENYKRNVEAQSEYYMQDIEIDATAFSAFVAQILFKSSLDLPSELKSEVDERVRIMDEDMAKEFIEILRGYNFD